MENQIDVGHWLESRGVSEEQVDNAFNEIGLQGHDIYIGYFGYLPSGYGHYKIEVIMDIDNEELTITHVTNNTGAIDVVKSPDEVDEWYDSVDEAAMELLDATLKANEHNIHDALEDEEINEQTIRKMVREEIENEFDEDKEPIHSGYNEEPVVYNINISKLHPDIQKMIHNGDLHGLFYDGGTIVAESASGVHEFYNAFTGERIDEDELISYNDGTDLNEQEDPFDIDYESGKTFNIKEESLREALKDALEQMHQYEWTGWRIPIYLDEETGAVSTGSILSNSSYQPDEHELPFHIETWSMDDIINDGDWDEIDMEHEINERIDYILRFKLESHPHNTYVLV